MFSTEKGQAPDNNSKGSGKAGEIELTLESHLQEDYAERLKGPTS